MSTLTSREYAGAGDLELAIALLRDLGYLHLVAVAPAGAFAAF